jgi:hypothetical protein
MKTMYRKINLVMLTVIITLSSCTNLDEEIFGSLSPNNYYQTEEEAVSSLVGVYSRMREVMNYNDSYRVFLLGTDEFIIPALDTGGWFDGGKFHEFVIHNVRPTNSAINGAWNSIFGVIGAANSVLESFENSPQAGNLKAEIAEVRALRAYAYFMAMDLWGNVPIFTDAKVSPTNLPRTNTRAEVYNFVVSEMQATITDLPSITTVNRARYYPRYVKETMQAALAVVYLNAQVYTGTPRWNEAIQMADAVINSGGYVLEPNFVTSFGGSNHNSRELIMAGSLDPTLNAGGNQYLRGAMHPRHQLTFNLPFVPANGQKTFKQAVDRYEDGDVRKNYVYYGPQVNAQGNPLTVANNSSAQLVLIPIVNYQSVAHNEGYRVLKYHPDGNWVDRFSSNDIVFIRYSEMLLIKAEALFRLNNGDARALELVNTVRTRSNATPLSSLTLQDIEDERAREFLWEGSRRRDMIRFGSYFNSTWKFKTTVTPTWRGIYPIPQAQINGNPNLQQNPNY